MSSSLTDAQARVLRVLRLYTRDRGMGPTLGELCDLTRTKSQGSMHKMLNKLVEKGFLEKCEGGWRQIRLRDACPCCGRKFRRTSSTIDSTKE